MFGRDSQPTKIFRYGAKCPGRDYAEILAEMRRAHQYRNKLCEIELRRRQRVENALTDFYPALAEAAAEYARVDAECEDVAKKIRWAKKSRARRRLAELSARFKELSKARREAASRLRERRRAAFQDDRVRQALAEIEIEARQEIKAARKESKLYWGNYLVVEKHCNHFRRNRPPHYKPWDGGGQIAVRIQNGITWQDLVQGTDTRVRLLPGVRVYGDGPTKWQHLWIRIGSDEKRKPIWGIIPVRIHRIPPEDARIKWIYILARPVGPDVQWYVDFAVSREAGWQRLDAAKGGAVGIDLGWRLLRDGSLRVAYWYGSDGEHGQITLSAKHLSRWEKADRLRRVRDCRMNGLIERLAPEVAAMPEELRRQCKSLRSWRSPTRFYALYRKWSANRYSGDEAAFQTLEEWVKKDRHLWRWEAHQRRKAQAFRDDIYRSIAASLSRRYRKVILENMDWRRPREKAAPGEKDRRSHFRRMAAIASPGKLRQFFQQRFAECELVRSANTTRRCSRCGESLSGDARNSLTLNCNRCGAEFDQDENAAVNLLLAGWQPRSIGESAIA